MNLLSPLEPHSRRGFESCSVFPRLFFFLFFCVFLLPSRIIPSRRQTRQVTAVVVAPREDTTEVSFRLCLNPAPNRGILSLSFGLVDTFPLCCRSLPVASIYPPLPGGVDEPRGVRLLPKGAPPVSRPCFASSRHIFGLLVIDSVSNRSAHSPFPSG